MVGLGGCAETTLAVNTAKIVAPDGTAGGGGVYKVGRPYQVRGRWYTPEDNMGYDEEGVASWYGPGFHGKRTANGERFDQNALTAAHPTLPMPTMVRVTNLDNGRTADLRVNDRGPFASNRIIDVSKRAAEVLGFRRSGTARVRVIVLQEQTLALRNGKAVESFPSLARVVPPPLPRPHMIDFVAGRQYGGGDQQGGIRDSSIQQAFVVTKAGTGSDLSKRWYVQAGAFSDPLNATRAASHLGVLAPTALSPITTDAGHSLVRVRLGPLEDDQTAARLLQVVRSSGYPGARLIEH